MLAWDADRELFVCDGNHDTGTGYVGAVFCGRPLIGADDGTVDQLRGVLSAGYPAHTIIQVSLVSTPDVDAAIEAYAMRGLARVTTPEDHAMMDALRSRRAEFLLAGKAAPLIQASGVLLNHQVLIVSIKIPTSFIPRDTELATAEEYATKLSGALDAIGFHLHRMKPPEYLYYMRRIFHMHGDVFTTYDEERLLRDQILAPGDEIQVQRDHIELGETNVAVLSVKQYPKTATIASMAHLTGDELGNHNQITTPWIMTTTMHYPDQRTASGEVRRKAQAITYQAYGPLLRFIPRLAYKKHGFDVLVGAMEDGEALVEMSFSIMLFDRDRNHLDRLASSLTTYYYLHQYEMAREQYITFPVFWNNLPLYPSHDTIQNMRRHRTMAVRHATQFLPVFGEWCGTGEGSASLFVTRKGQPLAFDLYDSSTSYNGVVFAESGGGKSFLVQQLITDYLSMGAKVWVIDVGRSYEKLARVVGGEFIEFSDASKLCLNPFTQIEDIDDETDLLKTLIARMAAPASGLDDYVYARIEEAIRAVWQRLGPIMTITDVWDYLLQQTDQRLRDLGNMLYSWTRHGSYGSWFDGPNNLQFTRPLVVLELEELKARKNLQQVVLLQLIAKIQHEMYLSGTDTKKILIIDEAWDLLDDPGVARFMETGYRRFRKYGGAALIITQSLNDLYASPNGRAIAENSPHLMILQQRAESVNSVERDGKLAIEPYGYHLLRSVSTVPGKYSEIFFHTGHGWGIGRLIVDRFSQVMYSTSGTERTKILQDIRDGIPAMAAIESYIEAEK